MPLVVPPLAFFCIHVLARVPDQLYHAHAHRIPAPPALLDALPHARDPWLWAALAQLVHPLPPHIHDHDLPLSHPVLPLLQKIPDSPNFSLVTLISLPNCVQLRDDDVAGLRSFCSLLALDLRGCSISSYALIDLARGLVPGLTSSGTWRLRLLSLHGCANIDNDVLPALYKFPLLSVIDLRFTRCTASAINAQFSSLGFGPSDNNALFHPAPLSLALCGLEKVALSASDPISLYSCPPQSVFRVHVDEINHLPSPTKKIIHVSGSDVSRPAIRTISSTEDTVVLIPPLRKPAKSESLPSTAPFVFSTAVSVTSMHPGFVSNVASFYESVPSRKISRKNIFPMSAQAVQISKGGKLDPLAIARSPPPWKILDTCKYTVFPNPVTVTCRQSASDNVENPRQTQPIVSWMGQALNSPLEVDRTRLHKRNSDAVADMVHQFASKRPRVESEFALAKMRARASIKPRNPFARNARSVFARSSTNVCDKPTHEFPGPKPDVQLRVSRSLPSKTVRQQGTYVEGTRNKPLKPITSFKPPILPKELLPSLPQHALKPRAELKQTRLPFAREGE